MVDIPQSINYNQLSDSWNYSILSCCSIFKEEQGQNVLYIYLRLQNTTKMNLSPDFQEFITRQIQLMSSAINLSILSIKLLEILWKRSLYRPLIFLSSGSVVIALFVSNNMDHYIEVIWCFSSMKDSTNPFYVFPLLVQIGLIIKRRVK